MLRDVTRDGHPGSALHIVIVERERLLRAGLERLLGGSPGMVVTGSVESIAAAEHLPAPTEADIVLAGADVPDMLGTEGVERLLTRFQNAQVVILGPEAEPGLVIAALRAGADGYLTRNIPPEGLVRALHGVERGEVALPRTLTRLLAEAIRIKGPLQIEESAVERLSAREREVLAEITRGRSNAEIALRLGVSESTVKTHVSNILRKTGSRSRFLLRAVGDP